MMQNWTAVENSDNCFCVIFGAVTNFISGKKTIGMKLYPSNFDLPLMFYKSLISWVIRKLVRHVVYNIFMLDTMYCYTYDEWELF